MESYNISSAFELQTPKEYDEGYPLNSTVIEDLEHSGTEQKVEFDLSGFVDVGSSDDDDECDNDDDYKSCEEFDLNKTYTTKTMSEEEIILMMSALDNSDEMISKV